MMTEAEAKTKWCPHIRISGTDRQSAMTNRCDTPTMTDCIASECMAWRRCDGDRRASHLDLDGNFYFANSNEKIAIASRDGYTALGYCGLSGKP